MNSNAHLQGIIAVACVLVFVASFAIGLGAVIWYDIFNFFAVSLFSNTTNC